MILLSGKARAGKDTFAIGLGDYDRYAFAERLKWFAKRLGWNGIKDDRGRKFLQDLASVCRGYNENVWVESLQREIESDKFPPKIVITDCRYKNEIQSMKQWAVRRGYNVYIIRIERPGYWNGLPIEMQRHASEIELDNFTFDYVVTNNKTIQDLEYAASSLLIEIAVAEREA